MRGNSIGRGDVLSGMMQEVTCNRKTAQTGSPEFGSVEHKVPYRGTVLMNWEEDANVVSQEEADERGGWSIG